mmetsp:Transcript_35642/g.94778  ORF Transcript_35642/g.94778 Transcript_35642/m.94778 type:complete len:249 (-) Transcript_35642:415-1161(-)
MSKVRLLQLTLPDRPDSRCVKIQWPSHSLQQSTLKALVVRLCVKAQVAAPVQKLGEGWLQSLAQIFGGRLLLSLEHFPHVLQPLPRQRPPCQVHEHVGQAFQIASARLRDTLLRVDGHVTVRASHLHVFALRHVARTAWPCETHCQSVVHQQEARHYTLVDSAFKPKHDVFWLQVAMYKTALVKLLKAPHKLCPERENQILRKGPLVQKRRILAKVRPEQLHHQNIMLVVQVHAGAHCGARAATTLAR